MNKRFYLGQDELVLVLDKLNTNISLEEAKDFVLEIYSHEDGTLKRHSYAHIGEYVKQNQELDCLFANLDWLIDEYAQSEKLLVKIIFKLKDHLEIEMSRQFERDDIQQQLIELRELKTDVEVLNQENIKNISEIRNMQGTITKEIVGISTILIAIITLVLGNLGAIQFINENMLSLTESGVTIQYLIFQVNVVIISGVTLLMLLIAAFIHHDNKKSFCATSRFWIPIFILVISNLILFFYKK